MNLLSDLEFEVIMDAAKRTHMMSVERRRLLLDGLPPDYIGRLASSSSPYDQLRSDLLELRRRPRLRTYHGPPLSRWLLNAEKLAGVLPERRLFRKYRIEVERRANQGSTSGQSSAKLGTSGHVLLPLARRLWTASSHLERSIRTVRTRIGAAIGHLEGRRRWEEGGPEPRPYASVHAVEPRVARMGELTEFLIIGENLPLTLDAWIHQGDDLSFLERSPTRARFTIVPRWTTGSKAAVIKDEPDGVHLMDFQVHFFR